MNDRSKYQQMKITLLSRSTDLAGNVGIEDNTGNIVYREAVHQMIPYNEMIDWGETERIKNSDADIFVVPLANVVRERFVPDVELIAGWEYGLRGRPLIGIGMGADAREIDLPIILTDKLQEWLNLFDGIWTRGEYTKKILNSYGVNAVSGCCPSLFMTDTIPNYDIKPGGLIASCNAGGTARAFEIERRTVENTKGSVYVQSPMKAIKPLMDGDPIPAAQYMKAGVDPARLFTTYDLQDWADDLKRHSLLISVRFHCAAWAFANGVPTVVIPSDLRTHEMCQSWAMPTMETKYTPGDMGFNELRALRNSFCESRFRENRFEKRTALRRFLRDHGIVNAKI